MPIISIFDLDGVLIDNHEFEINVHNILVQEIAIRRGCSLDVAREVWEKQLRDTSNELRWADYAFHCEALNLGEVYREAHYASAFLLMLTSHAQECLEKAAAEGPLWLATDATRWAWQFKFESLGVPADFFEERFDLDRCGVPKRDGRYWRSVEQLREERGLAGRYFDDRSECLSSASSVLNQTSTHLIRDGEIRSEFFRFG